MPDGTPILSDAQKTQWNSFQDHLGGDYPTPTALKSFNDANPKSTLTDAHIPVALNDVAAIKANPDVPGMTPAYKGGNNPRYPVTSSGGHVAVGGNPASIPKPDYGNPASRLKYAAAFRAKYGDTVAGFGDTPLRINETPENGVDTAKNASIKAASKVGIDPKLLYSSAMVEGMSGLYPDKNQEVDFSDNDKYPVNGFHNFGLDTFSDQAKGLIKKGYLPPDFANQYSPKQRTNEKGELVNSADFKTPDAALQATAAVIKDSQDQVEAYAKKNNINLSPKAKEFFALTAYNAGSGNMQKIMQNYNKSGALNDDKFIENRPNDTYKTIHENVKSRMVLRDALEKEGLF